MRLCPQGQVTPKPSKNFANLSRHQTSFRAGKSLPRFQICHRQSVNACWRCVQPGERLIARGALRRCTVRALPGAQPKEKSNIDNATAAEKPDESEQPNSLGVRVALSLLSFYKNGISPLLPPSCRYIPTCSAYAMEAYQEFGVGKGTVLTAWRLMRCSPFGSSGYDPVQWPPPGLGWIFKT